MAKNWRHEYQRWAEFPALDPTIRKQLISLRNDAQILEDCFYKSIEFGTGGMRGELGPGTNRMNVYTVRKASEGLARYINDVGEQARKGGVAIAYDSRHQSLEFAHEAAKVLGKHGIPVHMFDRLCPTPLLSFAVRHLAAFAGIVITASHNPPQYNGYKVYGPDGGQITLATADRLMVKINEVEDELRIDVAEEQSLKESGLLHMIGEELFDEYLKQVNAIRLHSGIEPSIANQLKIVFTPLHGTTFEPITKGLKAFGYDLVTVVREQASPDPAFSNVTSPNPEDPTAFEVAIKYGMEQDADIIFGTDPDGDRIGVATKNDEGDYIVLSGNQIGALLLDYVLLQKQLRGDLPKNGVVLKTIVTSEMGREIAHHYGLKTVDTLTGFKYIGEKIGEYEKDGGYSFQFGYEESCGYLIGDFVRDKDAVQTALFLADMCAYHKTQGNSLYDALLGLYQKYGFFCEELFSMTCIGKDGLDKISAILSFFRHRPLAEISSKKVIAVEDFHTGERKDLINGEVAPSELPKSNVLKFFLEDDSWLCLRPSGTEPKIKMYFGVKGDSLELARQKLSAIKQSLLNRINSEQWLTKD